jgi:hypothetical protein
VCKPGYGIKMVLVGSAGSRHDQYKARTVKRCEPCPAGTNSTGRPGCWLLAGGCWLLVLRMYVARHCQHSHTLLHSDIKWQLAAPSCTVHSSSLQGIGG